MFKNIGQQRNRGFKHGNPFHGVTAAGLLLTISPVYLDDCQVQGWFNKVNS